MAMTTATKSFTKLYKVEIPKTLVEKAKEILGEFTGLSVITDDDTGLPYLSTNEKTEPKKARAYLREYAAEILGINKTDVVIDMVVPPQILAYVGAVNANIGKAGERCLATSQDPTLQKWYSDIRRNGFVNLY
jgi:hypothetical protein